MSQSLQKIMVPQLVKKFPAFYGIELSLPHSQTQATCPYSKPDQYGPHLRNRFL